MMKRFVLSVAGFGLVAAIGASNPVKAQEATAATAPDRAQIEAIVREYILRNPDIVAQALRLSQARQEMREQAALRQAIAARSEQLFEDPTSPVRGNPDGDVTIVEFFDYRCGFCKRAYPVMERLLAKDPGVRLIYKEFPILGPDSVAAARIALAAGRQGRYQEMRDTLFQSTGSLSANRVLKIAEEMGFDMGKLKADMVDPEINAIIERNKALAFGLNIRGTPAYVIGTQLVPGYLDDARLAQVVARAREEQKLRN